MAEPGECGTSDAHLLRDTSDTFQKMAATARLHASSEEYRSFYSRLAAKCLRLWDYTVMSPQSHPVVVGRTLEHLGSLIPRSRLQEPGPDGYALTATACLQLLNFYWRNLLPGDERYFVHRWLRPSEYEEEREQFQNILEHYTDELGKQLPAELRQGTEDKSQRHLFVEPPFVVHKPAQSIFDALVSCKTCSCPKPHDFTAKFRLGTYRQQSKARLPRNTLRSMPRPRVNARLRGDTHFDMFVSMEEAWHEIRVRTSNERRVGFSIESEMTPFREVISPDTRERIEKLCEIMLRDSTDFQRLHLELSGNQLFEEGLVKKSDFFIDRTNESASQISLFQCLRDHRDYFTEKTKRLLSLIIGYAVLHLNETSWLKPGWGSENIRLFRTTDGRIPLKPFIETQLCDEEPLDKTPSFEGIDSIHCCPSLVSLAVVLIEIHFVRDFRSLAAMNNLKLLPTSHGGIAFVDVDQAFNGNYDDEDDGYYDDDESEPGLRSELPEDSQLVKAIDNCLDAELWENDCRALDAQTLRSRMYEKVIQPLELYLTHGFGFISMDNVDTYARKLDLSRWGMKLPESEPTDPLSRSMETATGSSSQAHVPLSGGRVIEGLYQMRPRDVTRTSRYPPQLPSNLGQTSLSDSDENHLLSQARFFHGDLSPRTLYDDWKSRYKSVYETFIERYTSDSRIIDSTSANYVKIAILDTGIDKRHPLLGNPEAIKKTINLYDRSQQRHVTDLNGHGTFVANLILDYAPDAHLYVIKVADTDGSPNAGVVKDAINIAVNELGVDIISMSFGWPSSDFPNYKALRDAIDKAHAANVLMFAAASNDGINLGRAYPASSPCVICVHSTNALGTRSPFSPHPEQNTANFSTVGESVLSVQPGCDEYVSRSGTSYATPILAGISAFLLYYVRIHIPGISGEFKRKDRMEALLKRCAERGPNYQSVDGYSYVELSRYQHNLFGKELKRVNDEIEETLRL